MAVKLRLTRKGKTNKAFYRVIAIDEHKKRDGRAIEILGTYDPHKTQSKVTINHDRLNYWLSVGATPSATLTNLLRTLNKS